MQTYLNETGVPLSSSDLHRLFDYDPFTGRVTWKKTLSGRAIAGNQAGYLKDGRHWQVGLHGQTIKLHRLIWCWMSGDWPTGHIDHINGDATDNRWTNLRDVNQATNNKNLPNRRDNNSGVPGVCWKQRDQRWEARISVEGKSKHLGSFRHLDDAIDARKQAEAFYDYHPNHGRKVA